MQIKLGQSLLTAVVIGLFAAPLLQAKKVEFPVDEPAFTFTMPDDWTTEAGKDGRIYCTAPDGFKIGIVASPGVSDDADAKKMLPSVLKGMADAMKCHGYKAQDAKPGKMGELSFVSMQGHCKSEDIEMALNAFVFSLEPGKYFTIVGAAPKNVNDAHDREMNELIRSITAVE